MSVETSMGTARDAAARAVTLARPLESERGSGDTTGIALRAVIATSATAITEALCAVAEALRQRPDDEWARATRRASGVDPL